mgnify:CR=1 FL=1
MDQKQKIASLMHSYADWNQIAPKIQPYHFEIEKDGKFFYYFGANHSSDPGNFQYPELKRYWDEFTSKTENGNVAVLIEGGLRPIANSLEEAITKNSEAGYITFLAHTKNLLTISPEPNRFEERQELLKQFSKEEVQYYYFARVIRQWNSLPNDKPSLPEYAKRFLQKDERDSKWSNFDFSLEHMFEIHKRIFNAEFNQTGMERIRDSVNPTINSTVINQVAIACSLFRNIHIVLAIEEFWKQGKSIFAVFGGGHVILEEPALRALLR